jgi:hypothetical protein
MYTDFLGEDQPQRVTDHVVQSGFMHIKDKTEVLCTAREKKERLKCYKRIFHICFYGHETLVQVIVNEILFYCFQI